MEDSETSPVGYRLLELQLSLLGTTPAPSSSSLHLFFPRGHLPQSWAGLPRSYYKSDAKAASHCARLSANPLPSTPQNPKQGLTLPLSRGGSPHTHWPLCSAQLCWTELGHQHPPPSGGTSGVPRAIESRCPQQWPLPIVIPSLSQSPTPTDVSWDGPPNELLPLPMSGSASRGPY